MAVRIIIVLIGYILVTGCASTATYNVLVETYDSHIDGEIDSDAISKVELGSVDWAIVSGSSLEQDILIGAKKGSETKYGSIYLLPGIYGFQVGRSFTMSILIDPDMHEERRTTLSRIYVEPGHTYRLNAARTTGSINFTSYFWVENVATGWVIDSRCHVASLGGATEVKSLAESGNPEAQYRLGKWYEEGVCITRSKANSVLDSESPRFVEAMKWYQLAAKKGNTDACLKLGDMYYRGIIVWKDIEIAGKWYLYCADSENRTIESRLNEIQKQHPSIWSRINSS